MTVRSVALAAALLIAGIAPVTARASDGIDTVSTPGSGSLTMCRSWVVYNSCTTYNKVAVPARVAVGDKLKLTYGSNPKDYIFRVMRIRRQGMDCTLYSDASGAGDDGERLEVAGCQSSEKQSAEKPAAETR